MKGGVHIKYSKQREAIFDYLKSVTTHPTAEVIYNDLKERHRGLSLATVYRNLALFSDRKEILKLRFEGQAERFDGDTSKHFHMVCEECGNVVDVHMPKDFYFNFSRLEIENNLKISDYDICFTGICSACDNAEEVNA